MPEFTITALETYRVTYKIQARTREEAIQTWERMNIKQTERAVLDDTVDRRINGEEF